MSVISKLTKMEGVSSLAYGRQYLVYLTDIYEVVKYNDMTDGPNPECVTIGPVLY